MQPEQLFAFLSGMLGEELAEKVGGMYAWEGATGQDKLFPNTNELRNKLHLDLPSFKNWAQAAFLK